MTATETSNTSQKGKHMQTIAERGGLLTLREVELILKRRVSTLRKDIAERRIAHVRIGRSVRIPRAVVDQLISEGWRDSVKAVD
jgi:excisionase family DNA binding protein